MHVSTNCERSSAARKRRSRVWCESGTCSRGTDVAQRKQRGPGVEMSMDRSGNPERDARTKGDGLASRPRLVSGGSHDDVARVARSLREVEPRRTLEPGTPPSPGPRLLHFALPFARPA